MQSDLAFADGSPEALKTLLPKQYEDRRGCPYPSLLEEVQGKFAHSAAYEIHSSLLPKLQAKVDVNVSNASFMHTVFFDLGD